MSQIIQGDALEELKKLADKSIELIITDPPYGLGIDKALHKVAGTQYGKAAAKKKDYGFSDWDNSIPTAEVFNEMFRVSKNQIIFGGNYFTDFLPPSRCWVTWDKRTHEKYNNDFADCEMVWTSFDKPSRIIRFLWSGMMQGDMKNKEKRLHPTQKPQFIMSEIIKRFAKPGDTILDPFAGSGSTLLAAKNLGYEYIGIELESRYIEIAKTRLAETNRA